MKHCSKIYRFPQVLLWMNRLLDVLQLRSPIRSNHSSYEDMLVNVHKLILIENSYKLFVNNWDENDFVAVNFDCRQNNTNKNEPKSTSWP